jgi:hypothetical protein
MTTETHNLINAVEDIKEKLSDQEYKSILDTTMKIHRESNQQADDELSPQAELICQLMEQLGGYNFRAYHRVISTDDDTRNGLFQQVKRDVTELQRKVEFADEKRDWLMAFDEWIGPDQIESSIQSLKTKYMSWFPYDKSIDCKLFYYYITGDYDDMLDDDQRELLNNWFAFIEDDDDDDDDIWYLELDEVYQECWKYENRNSIADWYYDMKTARDEHFAIANWIEEISAY